MFARLAIAASLVASAAAHATFQELWINGVDQGSSCVRLPLSNSPVTSVTTDVCRNLFHSHVLDLLTYTIYRTLLATLTRPQARVFAASAVSTHLLIHD